MPTKSMRRGPRGRRKMRRTGVGGRGEGRSRKIPSIGLTLGLERQIEVAHAAAPGTHGSRVVVYGANARPHVIILAVARCRWRLVHVAAAAGYGVSGAPLARPRGWEGRKRDIETVKRKKGEGGGGHGKARWNQR